MTRPLMLVPSSKAKLDHGVGPAYASSTALTNAPLAQARQAVLDALRQAADEAEDRQIARLCAIAPPDITPYRQQLRTLADAATMPAHRRYTGVVHRFAHLDAVDPHRVSVDVATFTGLLGVAMLDDPVPDYRLEVMVRVPGLGVLRTWWRDHLGAHLRAVGAGRTVWDLLPGEFSTMWPRAERGGIETIAVTFRRPDGRAAPSASAKVGKGQLVRLVVDDPTVSADDLANGDHLAGWRFVRSDTGLDAIQRT